MGKYINRLDSRRIVCAVCCVYGFKMKKMRMASVYDFHLNIRPQKQSEFFDPEPQVSLKYEVVMYINLFDIYSEEKYKEQTHDFIGILIRKQAKT